jgi:hypothetical protein
MCSTVSERLAQIGQAIDELAAETQGPGQRVTPAVEPAPGGPAAGGQAAGGQAAGGPAASLDDRLARIWLMMAELDPELARRVADYGGNPAS